MTRILPAVFRKCIVAFLLPFASIALSADDDDKTREVTMAIAPWEPVNRCLIEYETVPLVTLARSDPAQRIVAFASPGDLYHFRAYSSNLFSWSEDPFRQESFIRNGVTCLCRPFNRTHVHGTQQRDAPLTGTLGKDFIFNVVPKWFLTDYQAPVDPSTGLPVVPSEAIQSPKYHLLPVVEFVNGESCRIFDANGLDRLWIATGKGTCLMRRESRNSLGQLHRRIEAAKVTEIAPGLWMPMEFRKGLFADTDSGQQLEQWHLIRILRCEINEQVADRVFEPVVRAGALRFKDTSTFEQSTPGGENLLDEIVDVMVNSLGMSPKPEPTSSHTKWLLGGFVSGIVLVVGWLAAISFLRPRFGLQKQQ